MIDYGTSVSGIYNRYGYTDLGGNVGGTGFHRWALLDPTVGAPLAVPAVAASTGVNPLETSYSLYGHTVPLSVFGVGRIGGEIISGPWVENGMASFIISFGMPADPSGTRDLREIAFDSEVVWDSVNGFSNEGFTYRFYGGSLTQAADALEITHFGDDAVAYRPQMLIAFENLPLANTKFGKIPYVSAVIGDASGNDVNLGEAFERIAYSPWVGWTSDQFETSGITDGLVSGGLIIAQDSDFLSTIQQFGRFYPTWDILQTDKLRIVDRGASVTADIVLNKTRLMDAVTVSRQGADSIRKDLELSTIDPNADYTIVPSVAQRPRDPVSVTTSVGKDSAYLPAIMDSFTRTAIVTFAKYHEEVTRKTISGTAMAYGLEIEPGTLVAIRDLGDDFSNETFKVLETLHGANYVVEFTAASILRCSIGDDAPTLPTLTGLVGWWDASVFESLTIVTSGGGDEITGIADQSGQGNDLALIGSTGTPMYEPSGFNSVLPAMVFTGNGLDQQLLGNASFPIGTGNTLTIFAAVAMSFAGGSSGAAENGRLISYTAPAASHDRDNAGSFNIRRDSGNDEIYLQRNSINTTPATVGYSNPRRIIATIRSDGAMTVYVDGVVAGEAVSAGNWVSDGTLCIGGSAHDSNIFGGFFGGAIGEIGIATGYHDATVVTALDEYLKAKWVVI